MTEKELKEYVNEALTGYCRQTGGCISCPLNRNFLCLKSIIKNDSIDGMKLWNERGNK